jgi:hypothetical protein
MTISTINLNTSVVTSINERENISKTAITNIIKAIWQQNQQTATHFCICVDGRNFLGNHLVFNIKSKALTITEFGLYSFESVSKIMKKEPDLPKTELAFRAELEELIKPNQPITVLSTKPSLQSELTTPPLPSIPEEETPWTLVTKSRKPSPQSELTTPPFPSIPEEETETSSITVGNTEFIFSQEMILRQQSQELSDHIINKDILMKCFQKIKKKKTPNPKQQWDLYFYINQTRVLNIVLYVMNPSLNKKKQFKVLTAYYPNQNTLKHRHNLVSDVLLSNWKSKLPQINCKNPEIHPNQTS